MKLPAQYEWLQREPGPKMLVGALRYYGVRETQGPKNTPEIMRWAASFGPSISKVYTADSVPWCGLFMAFVAMQAGKPLPASPLWARSWASWGDGVDVAELGDVLVFVRPGGGHVGLYVGEDGEDYHVLGGNQGDAVSFRGIEKDRCIAIRRLYRVKPANVRRVYLSAGGEKSINEA